MPGPAAEALADGESVTYTPVNPPLRVPDLRIIHYNDVYHVDASSSEPVGGYARFQTLCDEYRSGDKWRGYPELVTVFSGDAFNPSLESSVTKGAHMVGVLNAVGTDVACVGVS
jgi:5'-nucleotidase